MFFPDPFATLTLEFTFTRLHTFTHIFKGSHPVNLLSVALGAMYWFTLAFEMLRSIIDHRKVFVLALNGPAVGGGAAWFTGIADIVLASSSVYLQVPFSALGLVPENGSAINFAQSMGVHRANEILMFGRELSVEELEIWGMVNQVFPVDEFQAHVVRYLEKQLAVNDGKSMMETKRLQNEPLRSGRLLAVANSTDALTERVRCSRF
jgi:peroxisomal 3,2-trans-enoyl-CoA isomerase